MTGHSHAKQRVALISVGASGLLTLAKFAVGLMTGSLAILSEALHSLLDFVSTVMTLYAVRLSDVPADDTHHYGHGKVESVTALVETGLLFVTSAWVIQEAVKRLIWHEGAVVLSPYAFVVVVGSIAIDFWRARALRRTAEATRSQALEADALHFASDMWSSIVVLAGLGLVWLGFPQGDAVAALAVAAFVCIAGWRLGKRTIDVLMDAAPEGVADRVAAAARGIEGVVAVDSVRVRRAGAALFVELMLRVPRAMPLDQVMELKQAVTGAVVATTPEAEVRVTASPIAIDDETVRERVLVIALNRGLAVHHVTVQSLGGRLSVSLDLEVEHRMPLGEAHAIASGLEAAIRREFGAETEVETHIEPLEAEDVEGRDVDPGTRERLTAIVAALTDAQSGLLDAHNVRVRATQRGLIVTFHCRAPAEMPVEEVHARVDAVERRIGAAWPGIARIIVHAEPVR
ncbi:cation-efflux pump [Labrys wisconsinensis]|uniref:Cation diffusion facilitator family transporter n=1 Tax=Labrys wisconsinensis TaxID=425677 RepID=A0ABU0J663_9HYPH|nr:cation-efflux pump [Labrys wisconsinensis]MDQ0469748.1 cation diffusion facilitator family transporter [Labrys wisconsinensis]